MRALIEQRQTQTQNMSQQMQQALFLLRMNALDLNEYLRQMVVDNPVLEMREPQNPFGRGEIYRLQTGGDFPQSMFGAAPYGDRIADVAGETTLKDQLLKQLDVRKLGTQELLAAKAVIDSLDSRSYFTEPLDSIMELCAVTRTQAKRALLAVQSLDPAGVGARSLSECLTLQLKRKGIKEPYPYKIASDYLDELGSGKYTEIASALNISVRRAKEYGGLIRSLWPGVDNGGGKEAIQYVYPEITVVRDGDRLEVLLDEKRLPVLTINPEYRDLGKQDVKAKEYLKEQYRAANRIVSSLELWKTMLRRVAEKIVDVQKEFFLAGEALRPMRLVDLSQALKVNISTVSRAVAGKYLICEQGVFSLKHFFVGGIAADQTQVSSDYVCGVIRQELKRDPSLSDSAMAELLNGRGITIARRTVAKYRTKMGIASMYRRQDNTRNSK